MRLHKEPPHSEPKPSVLARRKELKDKPNSKLCGHSFDAQHLDKFLLSEYGSKAVYISSKSSSESKKSTEHSKRLQNYYKLIQSNIR